MFILIQCIVLAKAQTLYIQSYMRLETAHCTLFCFRSENITHPYTPDRNTLTILTATKYTRYTHCTMKTTNHRFSVAVICLSETYREVRSTCEGNHTTVQQGAARSTQTRGYILLADCPQNCRNKGLESGQLCRVL
jgi:hypothetical protein